MNRDRAAISGFSLVETVISLGIIAFCLIAVIGLLPTGLSTQQRSQEEARAASALNLVASAVESLTRTNQGKGQPTWAFPNYFSDNPNPSSSPTIVWVGQQPWTYTFFISEGGMIIANNDSTTPRRQTLYAKVYPPQVLGQAVVVYAAVAWPYKANDSSTTTPGQMIGRQGFVDTIVASSPPTTF